MGQINRSLLTLDEYHDTDLLRRDYTLNMRIAAMPQSPSVMKIWALFSLEVRNSINIVVYAASRYLSCVFHAN